MSGEEEKRYPTDQEVAGWFEENFGSTLFPSESRQQWVREHWQEVGGVEEAPGEERKSEARPDKKLLGNLCPDLLTYFDGSSEGLFVVAPPKASHSDANYEIDRFEALRTKVEDLERLVSRLSMAILEIEFRRNGQNTPNTTDGSH